MEYIKRTSGVQKEVINRSRYGNMQVSYNSDEHIVMRFYKPSLVPSLDGTVCRNCGKPIYAENNGNILTYYHVDTRNMYCNPYDVKVPMRGQDIKAEPDDLSETLIVLDMHESQTLIDFIKHKVIP